MAGFRVRVPVFGIAHITQATERDPGATVNPAFLAHSERDKVGGAGRADIHCDSAEQLRMAHGRLGVNGPLDLDDGKRKSPHPDPVSNLIRPAH